jgi:pimeloyl-ACP methyl ester carboxylesterase
MALAIIRFLRTGGRELLASACIPQRMQARSAAIVLCNPFGEEATRAHRAYRVLAGKLEAAGYATMRFDYAGTGDSSGDSGAFGIDDWLDDIAAAIEALRLDSGVSRVALVGLRLGGTLAALHARRPNARIAHLLLWDPVVDGCAYLRELGQLHRAYLQAETGRLLPDLGDAPTESLGTPIDACLRQAMASIDLAGEPAPRSPLTTVLCTQRTPELQRLHQAWAGMPSAPRWIDIEAPQAWNSDAALNSAIVPIDEVSAIVERIQACHP